MSASLASEKWFRKLLVETENRSKNKSIEVWKLAQFVDTLQKILDMDKTTKLNQVDEYRRRIEILRQSIDLDILEEQTFPREVLQQEQSTEPIEEQLSEESTPLDITKTQKSSNRSDNPNFNRQQQQIQSEEDRQDEIASLMRTTTKSLLNSAKRLNDIAKDDRKKLLDAENLIDNNSAKLNIQSKRLKHHAYSGSSCWIYLMLIVVILTFICLTLFMRTFRKRAIKVTYSHAKSSLLNGSIDQTAINTTNITTTTKSTDYISLLLNYANENHTDL